VRRSSRAIGWAAGYSSTVVAALLAGLGCVRPPKTVEYPEVRAVFEREFADRTLDPIEGFWQSKNEYAEGVGVIYRTDPAENLGFPYAARAVCETRKVPLPYPMAGDRIVGRWKPGTEPGVYQGQVLMFRANREFWMDATLKLIDATTAEAAIHTKEPVLGGSTQRGYYVGPEKEMKARLARSQSQRAPQDETRPSAGSGFLISDSLLVTSFHVVRGAKTVRCTIGEAERIGTIAAQDQDVDLAILKLQTPAPPSASFLKLGNLNDVKQGQTVFAMGFPLTDVLGTGLSVHRGIVSSLTGFEGRWSQLQLGMSVNPGNSGGPVVDETGTVLAVVRAFHARV
jgi:S1-C subfamily serine protease